MIYRETNALKNIQILDDNYNTQFTKFSQKKKTMKMIF
jgi:hypothetical protein